MILPKESLYTIDDIYALPNGKRAELLDGEIYYMTPPSRRHQRIVGEVFAVIREYIVKKGGICEVNIAPFAVYDFENDAAANYTFSDNIPVRIYPGFFICLFNLI